MVDQLILRLCGVDCKAVCSSGIWLMVIRMPRAINEISREDPPYEMKGRVTR